MQARRLIAAGHAAAIRHPALRYLQIVPVAALLWGLDDAASFRTRAALAGLRNAVAVNSISRQLGGAFAEVMNSWLAAHQIAALAASWYYILLQGAITGVVGIVLIWQRAPHFALHRDALIAVTAIGLVTFWLYPVAPPRMLPGYHDIIARAVPTFASTVEAKGADQFASLPSLHVAWALWVALACSGLLRHRALRIVIWLYPAATVLDVLATANHYLLDVITAPAILALAYAAAAIPALVRQLARQPPCQPHRDRGLPHGGGRAAAPWRHPAACHLCPPGRMRDRRGRNHACLPGGPGGRCGLSGIRCPRDRRRNAGRLPSGPGRSWPAHRPPPGQRAELRRSVRAGRIRGAGRRGPARAGRAGAGSGPYRPERPCLHCRDRCPGAQPAAAGAHRRHDARPGCHRRPAAPVSRSARPASPSAGIWPAPPAICCGGRRGARAPGSTT